VSTATKNTDAIKLREREREREREKGRERNCWNKKRDKECNGEGIFN
jgi:hypothetical protein